MAATDAGLQVIDISEPAEPCWTADAPQAGNAFGVAVAGNYAYLIEARFGNDLSPVNGGALQVFAIDNPREPKPLGRLATQGAANSITVAGNLACVSEDPYFPGGILN